MSDAGGDNSLAAGQGSWLEWPRLYLDTGLLLKIADGRMEGPILTGLLTIMAELPAVLVVSRDHMQDVMPRSGDDNRDKFAAAVERFSCRAVVVREPREIEPWTEGPQDIGLFLIGDFLELLKDPEARPHLAELAVAQEQLYVASSASQAARRTSPPLSPRGSELVLECLVTLVADPTRTDVADILTMHETRHEETLSLTERESVVATLTPLGELLRDYRRRYAPTDDDRVKLLRDFRDYYDDTSRVHSPGMFLARRLTGCWLKNVHRKPRRSDSLDGMHASYFPYVDVATCDSSAFACLEQYLGSVKGPRSPRVFRNNDLASAVAALTSLVELPPSNRTT